MIDGISRRVFLIKSTVGLATATAAMNLEGVSCLASVKATGGPIPKRQLGKTGVMVSQLAFGGGSRFVQYKTDEEAIRVLNWAIDHGINYVDTAHSYGDGVSETRYGMVMKDRRKDCSDFYLCGRQDMIRDVTLLIDEEFQGSLVYSEVFY